MYNNGEIKTIIVQDNLNCSFLRIHFCDKRDMWIDCWAWEENRRRSNESPYISTTENIIYPLVEIGFELALVILSIFPFYYFLCVINDINADLMSKAFSQQNFIVCSYCAVSSLYQF